MSPSPLHRLTSSRFPVILLVFSRVLLRLPSVSQEFAIKSRGTSKPNTLFLSLSRWSCVWQRSDLTTNPAFSPFLRFPSPTRPYSLSKTTKRLKKTTNPGIISELTTDHTTSIDWHSRFMWIYNAISGFFVPWKSEKNLLKCSSLVPNVFDDCCCCYQCEKLSSYCESRRALKVFLSGHHFLKRFLRFGVVEFRD